MACLFFAASRLSTTRYSARFWEREGGEDGDAPHRSSGVAGHLTGHNLGCGAFALRPFCLTITRPKSAALRIVNLTGPRRGSGSRSRTWVGAHTFFGGGQRSRPSSQNTTDIQISAIHGLTIDREATHRDGQRVARTSTPGPPSSAGFAFVWRDYSRSGSRIGAGSRSSSSTRPVPLHSGQSSPSPTQPRPLTDCSSGRFPRPNTGPHSKRTKAKNAKWRHSQFYDREQEGWILLRSISQVRHARSICCSGSVDDGERDLPMAAESIGYSGIKSKTAKSFLSKRSRLAKRSLAARARSYIARCSGVKRSSLMVIDTH